MSKFKLRRFVALLVCVAAASALILAATGSAFAAAGRTVPQKVPIGKSGANSRPLTFTEHFGW